MRKSTLLISTLILVQLFFAGLLPMPGFAENPPGVGGIFPDLNLPLPNKVDERNYLGVAEGPFNISQIKTQILIIEIFSMYCPYCQKEAPNVNGLFQELSGRADLKSRVKLMGIGAGNTQFEVNAFRNLYRIEFPLIPDDKLAIHKLVGEVGTPYFFVLRMNAAPGRIEVLYSRSGTFGQPAAFLDMIADKIGPEKK